MKEYNINFTDQFLEELDEALYFFPYSNITRRKLYTEIRNTILSLEIFPERYNKMNETKKIQENNIRKLPINKFVVIYEVDNKKGEAYLLHIFSQKQDYLNLI